MKRKLAALLVSALLGWLCTVAIADDETPAVPADSSADTTEPATMTDTSTESNTDNVSDGTAAATPAETESK